MSWFVLRGCNIELSMGISTDKARGWFRIQDTSINLNTMVMHGVLKKKKQLVSRHTLGKVKEAAGVRSYKLQQDRKPPR